MISLIIMIRLITHPVFVFSLKSYYSFNHINHGLDSLHKHLLQQPLFKRLGFFYLSSHAFYFGIDS